MSFCFKKACDHKHMHTCFVRWRGGYSFAMPAAVFAGSRPKSQFPTSHLFLLHSLWQTEMLTAQCTFSALYPQRAIQYYSKSVQHLHAALAKKHKTENQHLCWTEHHLSFTFYNTTFTFLWKVLFSLLTRMVLSLTCYPMSDMATRTGIHIPFYLFTDVLKDIPQSR